MQYSPDSQDLQYLCNWGAFNIENWTLMRLLLSTGSACDSDVYATGCVDVDATFSPAFPPAHAHDYRDTHTDTHTHTHTHTDIDSDSIWVQQKQEQKLITKTVEGLWSDGKQCK